LNVDQLIHKCIKKDRKAQELLYTTYRKKLFPVCLKYCRSHTEAEDHLHDVFIEIFDKIRKYNGTGSFEGWMKRIAINKAIDKYKGSAIFSLNEWQKETLTESTTLHKSDLPPSWEALMRFVQELPTQYRLVFNLFELDEYSHKEIAEMLQISENTSKSNLHRGKAILKKRILALKEVRPLKTGSNGR